MEVTFTYTNYKGVTSERTVAVECLEFLDKPGFGYQSGWFLSGIDLDKQQRRSFALPHIKLPGRFVTGHRKGTRLCLPLTESPQ